MAFIISDTSLTITTAGGTSRTITGIDSIAITNSRVYTTTYSADNTDNFGVRSLTGVQDPDSMVVTITSANIVNAEFLLEIFLANQRVNLSVIDNINDQKKYVLLNAVVGNSNPQTSIDSDAGSKLVYSYFGRLRDENLTFNNEETA